MPLLANQSQRVPAQTCSEGTFKMAGLNAKDLTKPHGTTMLEAAAALTNLGQTYGIWAARKALVSSLPPTGLPPRRSLFALLSQVLVAFTVEFDNEFKRRCEAGYSGARLSLVVWANIMRFVGEDGIPSMSNMCFHRIQAQRLCQHLISSKKLMTTSVVSGSWCWPKKLLIAHWATNRSRRSALFTKTPTSF